MKKATIEIYRDGDQWCALLGENIQEGIAGFGDTPAHAVCNMLEMDKSTIQCELALKRFCIEIEAIVRKGK